MTPSMEILVIFLFLLKAMRTSTSTAMKTNSVINSMNVSGYNFVGNYKAFENNMKAQTRYGRIDEMTNVIFIVIWKG